MPILVLVKYLMSNGVYAKFQVNFDVDHDPLVILKEAILRVTGERIVGHLGYIDREGDRCLLNDLSALKQALEEWSEIQTLKLFHIIPDLFDIDKTRDQQATSSKEKGSTVLYSQATQKVGSNFDRNPNTNSGTMRIVIKGWTGKMIPIYVAPDSSVKDVLQAIFRRVRYRPSEQQLVFKDQEMQENHSLASYGVRSGDIVNITRRK